MTSTLAAPGAAALPLHLVEEGGLTAISATLSAGQANWAAANGFTGALGQLCVLPGAEGHPSGALLGMGTEAKRRRGRFHVARAAAGLPEGDWAIATHMTPAEAEAAALGWNLAAYRFSRYKADKPQKARLVLPAGVDGARIDAIVAGECLTRDLINTPASDMGPEELEAAFLHLASEFGAEARVIRGDELLSENFPLIHAVGRASSRAPRLLDLRWGAEGPSLTLVGKGVCFDTGGLDIKPASSMGLMKKDMGGAAAVLGLARMIMALRLRLRLRVLVPAVENAVGGNAFRPQDVLHSRKGLTVEVNNTDAEGRLVLADALALADADRPDLLISMATLTGAARVAVGPDLAPFYCDDDRVADALAEAGQAVSDPLWRMPFWDPYEPLIEPAIADLDNAPAGGMAGSITAALFLRRFVTETPRYVHFDIYGWQPTAAPARPKGGVGQGARAVLDALPGVLGL
ncbi:leucyl aminopeptidase family protein [Albidovulum sediminicola]|uniref:Leucyl aminopeptidase family protein n=1 Tax=Albidovulum sediminicola TaxID=2984331 RepID=A0ABT2YYK7_9RHOB|nr:leucyl aminopeptidase family protein [Defluviimonas sp. WL0075]MCV2863969.1 leucyl aminopeptidase family protein [Defluviimonas sp. WL0075]